MVIGAESFQDKDHIKLKEITLQQRNPWTNQKIRDLDISRKEIPVHPNEGWISPFYTIFLLTFFLFICYNLCL